MGRIEGPGLSDLQALVCFIQANPHEELTLAALSARSGRPSYRLHRAFKRFTGETPARFVARTRLEQAAEALVLREASVLETALAHGFRSPETFVRAFRRRYHTTPSAFRARGWLRAKANENPGSIRQPGVAGYALSPTRLQMLKPHTVLCRRHVGAYDTVPSGAWERLLAFCRARRLHVAALVGVGWDDPALVPVQQCRFDAGVVVNRGVRSPSSAFRVWTLPPGPWAVTRHAGAYGTLTDAYPTIAAASRALNEYTLAKGPALEIYHTRQMRSDRPLEHTDVYLPLRPAPARGPGCAVDTAHGQAPIDHGARS